MTTAVLVRICIGLRRDKYTHLVLQPKTVTL
jgi:hypothetical protein